MGIVCLLVLGLPSWYCNLCPSWVLGSGASFLLGAGEGSSIGWLLMAVYSCVSPSMMFALDGGS